MKKSRNRYVLLLFFLLASCAINDVNSGDVLVAGKMKVGFDIDDTVVFSRDTFLKVPPMSDDADDMDYAWINAHDSLYSTIIWPIAHLIHYYRSQGHEVYFITARPGDNGEIVARYLTDQLGFKVTLNQNLFFSPKERDPVSGIRLTTKHRLISKLGLHMYFGDSDTDMIAASIAGVRAIRVVRDQRSVEAYSKNYFGDMLAGNKPSAPFDATDYQKFLALGVGPYGETIYPIFTAPELAGSGQE